jgi:hypothetical protein
MATDSTASYNPFGIDILQDHNMALGLSPCAVWDESHVEQHHDHNRTTADGSLIPPIGYMQRQPVVDDYEGKSLVRPRQGITESLRVNKP